MKWFKHFGDCRRNPKIRAIERQMGEAGYCRALKLFEIVAQVGGVGAEFDPRIDLGKPTTNREWLADELGIDVHTLDTTLHELSKVGLIVARSLKHDVIAIPQMLEYKDEYASRKSGVTPDKVGSESGITPSKSEEVRGQSEEVRDKKAESLGNSLGHLTRCASDSSDVFVYTGLDQERMGMGERCLKRFKELFSTYPQRVSHCDGKCTCSAEDFLEDAMETMRAEKVRWPPALLKRKKEIEESHAS